MCCLCLFQGLVAGYYGLDLLLSKLSIAQSILYLVELLIGNDELLLALLQVLLQALHPPVSHNSVSILIFEFPSLGSIPVAFS